MKISCCVVILVVGIARADIDALDFDAGESSDPFFEQSNLATGVTTHDDLWNAAVERGDKLVKAMKGTDQEAGALYNMGDSAASPFDGDLYDTLREWGYNDNNVQLQKDADKECNMDSNDGHRLAKAFSDLHINTLPAGKGGDNTCFQFNHYDGSATKRDDKGNIPDKKNQRYDVCGKEYAVTGAELLMGANAPAGAVFAINRQSPAKAARSLWRRAPKAEELPAIRSASDMAWAAWNRVARPGSIQDIRYLFVTMVINKETNQHIKRIMGGMKTPRETPDGWPGHDFNMDSDEAKALLGSPNGRWAGYFLVQHKRQLGERGISKVRVFVSEKEGSFPYFLFYVEAGEPRRARKREDGKMVGRVVKL